MTAGGRRLKPGRAGADHLFVQTEAGATHRDPQAGLTLVEVMVAMVLFVVGSLSLLSVLTSSMTGTFDNRARVTAANLAASDIDAARSVDYYSLPVGSTTYDRTVDGRVYKVVRDVQVTMSSGAATSSCVGSGSARQAHKRVSTRVETAFRGRTRPVRADTLVRAPVFDPNGNGAIAFVVIDRQGSPLSGLPVSVPGVSRTSDANGCAFLDGLPAGTHEVTVVRSGSVTLAGSTALRRSVPVTAGLISSAVLRIDTAATITVRAAIFDGSSVISPNDYNLPTGLTATIAAPDRATPTRTVYPGRSVTPTTANTDLTWTAFPSKGGYDAYLGPCTAIAHSDSEPGTTPPRMVLSLSPTKVKLKVPGSQDTKARDKEVRLFWLEPGCSETLTYAARSNSTCTNTCEVRLAVPAGRYLFRVYDSAGVASNDFAVATVPHAKESTVEIEIK